MAVEVVMPKLGLTMTEGKIARWLKEEGEKVTKGEPLLEVMTEKIVTEVESPGEGILAKIFNFAEEVVPIGIVIAVIAEEGENVEDIVKEAQAEGTDQKTEPAAGEREQGKGKEREAAELKTQTVLEEQGQPQRLKVSPIARRLVEKENISRQDLQEIKGTGPGGRIIKKDILSYVKQKESTLHAAEKRDRVEPLSDLRKAIARRMTQSWTSTPHFYLEAEVDASNLLDIRKKINEILKKEDSGISVTDLLVKIVATVLAENRYMNASYTEDGLVYKSEINIGVAVALDAGLIVPVLKNADQKGLREIPRENRELIKRAREGKLSLDDISGGTFTVSNLGMFPVDTFTAIINPPECAILSVGRVIEKPVYQDNEVIVKPCMKITLGLDHRVIDGAQGAKFLGALKEIIEKPYLLVL